MWLNERHVVDAEKIPISTAEGNSSFGILAAMRGTFLTATLRVVHSAIDKHCRLLTFEKPQSALSLVAMSPPPRRKLQEAVDLTLTPPDSLPASQTIARVVAAKGKNLYQVTTPSETLLVELEAKFRSTIWMKRGGYVLIDTTSLAVRDNKIDGEIVNVVRDEKEWRKAPFWPKEFSKKPAAVDSDGEESKVGQMPPSDDEDV